jgi:hydroxypyruvate reductase/glycerate 2-kinase
VSPRETDLAAEAAAIWRAGVDSVLPAQLMRRAVQVENGMLRFEGAGTPRKFKIRLDQVRRIAVVGAGKAGAGMAAALEEQLGDVLAAKDVHGLVNVPDSTVVPLQRIELHGARATHENAATPAALDGTRRVREIVGKLRREDLLIVLLSGGGSALLPMPIEGVTLEEKQRVVSMLQARGADIRDVNCVRKHLSDVKGGGLARWTRAGLVVTLAISDVSGDPMDVIASGPTAQDPTTFSDALRVLEAYGLDERDPEVPASVLAVVREGSEGVRPDTMKILPAHVKNLVIGGIDDAVRGAERHAKVLGWKVLASAEAVGGETRELARMLASFIRGADAKAAGDSRRGLCLISGGETTTVLGANPGRGGRNQELVLAVLAELGTDGFRGACALSGGTDGEDGPTDAAGAWADRGVARSAADLGLDPRAFLEAHDSYRFFAAAGGHLKTGWTGTNVTDLRVVLVDPAARARTDTEEPTVQVDTLTPL